MTEDKKTKDENKLDENELDEKDLEAVSGGITWMPPMQDIQFQRSAQFMIKKGEYNDRR